MSAQVDIDEAQINIQDDCAPASVPKELEGSAPAADDSAPASDAGNDIMKSFGGAKQ